MNRRDICIGSKVYHTCFCNFGQGTVVGYTTILEWKSRGYREKKGYEIKFENIPDKKIKCTERELRKTEDKRKIALLKELKERRDKKCN